MTEYQGLFEKIADDVVVEPLSSYSKTFDSPAKSQSYYTKIITALHSGNFSRGGFTTMVKSGEKYTSTFLTPEFEHSSRPRNICVPKSFGYALHGAV